MRRAVTHERRWPFQERIESGVLTPDDAPSLFDPVVPNEIDAAAPVDSAAAQPKKKRARRPRVKRRPRAHHAHINPKNRYALVDLGWLQDPRLSLDTLRVLVVLSSHADQDSGACFPLKATIAREAGMKDPAQVRRALKKLEDMHAVARELRPRTSTRYWVQPAPDIES